MNKFIVVTETVKRLQHMKKNKQKEIKNGNLQKKGMIK